jgi:leucyl/phenylalanyl-tRNA--protein transferase
MAEARDDPDVFWVDPRKRGILPLNGFHISRSLRKNILRQPFRITINTAFNEVVAGCAARDETWINAPIAALYRQLHTAGFAHALEVWEDQTLVGGVYGVTLGAAFFGESMFSKRPNASKIALAYLVHRLHAGGFTLFDTQFVTPHLLSLGAIEIPRAEYRRQLEAALEREADFLGPPAMPPAHDVIQRSTQTS